MTEQRNKKRGPWFEAFLISSILVLVSIIFYFTMANRDIEDIVPTSSATENILKSNISEDPSELKGVSLIHLQADHTIYPFDIFYPKTKHNAFNDEVFSYITAIKDDYLHDARNAYNKQAAPAMLTTETNLYAYDKQFYSFVLTTVISLPNEQPKTLIETFFIDNATGKQLTLSDIFNDDDKSLQTFASHIEQEIQTVKQTTTGIVEDKFGTSWQNFQYFALRDEELILYFTNQQLSGAAAVMPMTVSLSYLNPLLYEPFQTSMEKTETELTTEEVRETLPDASNLQAATEQKRIALTFDDGPHPTVTPQILAILAKYKAKATFYVLGNRVKQSPEIVLQALEEGHEIGNHTWSHPKLPNLTLEQVQSEFSTTENLLQQLTGAPSKTFRPPYGASSETVESIVPMPIVNWSIDTEDWRHRNPHMTLSILKQSLHNNSIVLMHDIHDSTAQALDSVLAYLQQEGYTFMTVSEILPYR